MKTLRSKDLLTWITLLIAIMLFSFTICFAQPTKDSNNVLHRTSSSSYNRVNLPPVVPISNPVPNPHPMPPYIPPPPPTDTASVPKGNTGRIEGEYNSQFADESKSGLNSNDVNTYPNPSDGKFTLVIHPAVSGSLEIRIADITGKEIYAQNIDNFSGDYNKLIDLSNKGKGIYILSIAQNNEQLTKKIVID